MFIPLVLKRDENRREKYFSVRLDNSLEAGRMFVVGCCQGDFVFIPRRRRCHRSASNPLSPDHYYTPSLENSAFFELFHGPDFELLCQLVLQAIPFLLSLVSSPFVQPFVHPFVYIRLHLSTVVSIRLYSSPFVSISIAPR